MCARCRVSVALVTHRCNISRATRICQRRCTKVMRHCVCRMVCPPRSPPAHPTPCCMCACCHESVTTTRHVCRIARAARICQRRCTKVMRHCVCRWCVLLGRLLHTQLLLYVCLLSQECNNHTPLCRIARAARICPRRSTKVTRRYAPP